jgi:hypothetical protein
LANYTGQSLDHSLPAWRLAEAAKFIIHFVGDLHQPLHNEDVARGGKEIYVKWDTRESDLHQVWDSFIAEKWIGGLRGKPDPLAQKWANQLAIEITDGKFRVDKEAWLKDFDLNQPKRTAMAWSREANALVCTHGEVPQRRTPLQSTRLTCCCYSFTAGPSGNHRQRP